MPRQPAVTCALRHQLYTQDWADILQFIHLMSTLALKTKTLYSLKLFTDYVQSEQELGGEEREADALFPI